MKTTKAHILKAARARWGEGIEAIGYLNTIGPASGPYTRDGQKEFHAMVRRTDLPSSASYEQVMLVNVTAPSATEAWTMVLQKIQGDAS